MTVIATASNPQFSVSRSDIDRAGKTYTIDTLRDLRAEHPGADLFFITGADALSQIFSWRDARSCSRWRTSSASHGRGIRCRTRASPRAARPWWRSRRWRSSSTDCRQRVAKGDPVWYLVPDGVVRYIDKRALYRDTAG